MNKLCLFLPSDIVHRRRMRDGQFQKLWILNLPLMLTYKFSASHFFTRQKSILVEEIQPHKEQIDSRKRWVDLLYSYNYSSVVQLEIYILFVKCSENWNDIQSNAENFKTGKNWSLNWPFIVDVMHAMQWFPAKCFYDIFSCVCSFCFQENGKIFECHRWHVQ